MTLVVDLTPAEAARLRSAARKKGLQPEELARQLIAGLEHLENANAPALVRVSEELRAMGRKALREHAAGRTEEFPP
jgi:hypothetical protein